jgi:predicted DNA-binding transcriptional regulator YafY
MLAELMQGSTQGVTLDQMVDRFEISRRTAERMRDTVWDLFPQDYKEMRDGSRKFFKLRTRRLDALTIASLASFTEKDLTALPMAAKILRQNNLVDQAEVLERVLNGLNSLRKPEPKFDIKNLEDLMKIEGVALRPGPRFIYNEEIVGLLREALGAFHQVRVTYRKNEKNQDFKLIPLGFLYGERHHYLVARHADGFMEGRPHYFILSRIEAVEMLDEVFEEDHDFNLAEYAARSFGVYQEEPFEVEWRFSPKVADEAADYVFHPSQEKTRNQDGSLTVRFTAGGRLEMAWHLYTWEDEVKVLKPADFWETLPKLYGKR